MQKQIINMSILISIKKKDEGSHIVSLDTNSLYSTPMCYNLPYGEPKFDNSVSKYILD